MSGRAWLQLFLERLLLYEASAVDTFISLGRAPTNQVVIEEPTVSSVHAVIWREGRGTWVRELRASNGTFLNDEPIVGPTVLNDGDRLALGPKLAMRVAIPQFAQGWLAPPDEPTLTTEPGVFDYSVWISMGSGDHPRAKVRAPALGLSLEVSASNRVLLLFLLANQLLEDRAKGLPVPERGWCTDTTVRIGVWGAKHVEQSHNSLNVLIYRLRADLEAAGFDPACIEKQSRRTRLKVRNAYVE